jgi:hypothetical protein
MGSTNKNIDWSKVKAATVKLNVDRQKLEAELKSIVDDRWLIYTNDNGDVWKSMFINKNSKEVFRDFKTAKSIPHSEWYWDETLDTPYLKELVESLPLSKVGMIRAFILNGPLVMHKDSHNDTPNDLNFKIGLTISTKIEGPMQLEESEPVEGYDVLFNDAYLHGFPNSTGEQISIRVFGEFDYDKFEIIKLYK